MWGELVRCALIRAEVGAKGETFPTGCVQKEIPFEIGDSELSFQDILLITAK